MASDPSAASPSRAVRAQWFGAGGRVALYFAAISALVLISLVAGVAIGSSPIPLSVVSRVLLTQMLPQGWGEAGSVSDAQRAIVWLVRAPRVLVAASVGASLAVAGAQMQGIFRNPLASPDILGASSGAAFGAVVALASGLAIHSMFYLPVLAFVGALVVLFLVYALATQHGRTPVTTLLLAGVAVNALVGAATSFLITANWVRYEVAQDILFWLMGGLDSRTWEHLWLDLPCLTLGLILAMTHARDLDAMLLGEEAALNVGVDVERVKRVVITGAALLAGGAVAVSGVIGFVGLVVPHVVRLAIGPKHRWLLPASALTGAVFLIVADAIARTLLSPTEIRLGIVTAAFGSPFFLWLLMRQQRALIAR